MKHKELNKLSSKALRIFFAFSLVLGIIAPISLSVPRGAEAATTKQAVGIETPDIEITLFNYGTKINDVSDKVLGFTFGNGDVDGSGIDGGSANVFPTLGYENGYPAITSWLANSNDKTGSLQYLFNKEGTDYIAGTNGNSSYIANDGNYQFKRFVVDTVQIFQKNHDSNMYVYNSAYNAAEYDPETKSLIAYNYALRPFTCSGNGEANVQGHFLPFNSIDQAVQVIDSSGNELDGNLTDGMTDLTVGTGKTDLSSTDVTNLYALKTSGTANRADMAFGMSVEFSFNMPEDGRVINSSGEAEDMIFDFMGDDDVIVYIDGVPVLNVGGAHPATKGTINFATGEVAVYETGSASNKVTDGRCTTLKELFQLSGETFDDYTTHTLQFYYLERYGTNSNCWLQFNLEPIPVGNVTLEKEVVGVNESLNDDQEYEFSISAIDANGNAAQGIKYTVATTSASGEMTYGEEGTVSHGGTIPLRANETAIFTNLTAGTKVKFTENDNNLSTAKGWTLNGNTVEEGCEQTVPAKGELKFICINERMTGELEVSKVFDETSGSNIEPERVYEMTLRIDGQPYSGAATLGDGRATTIEEGAILLKAGEMLEIEGIPTGYEYELSEKAVDSVYLYNKPMINGTELSFGTAYSEEIELGANRVVVENSRQTLSLTVTKKGVSALDHHEASSTAMEERQSTIFEIKGSSTGVSLTVAICGEDSATIQDLPIDTYTVTELTDWSWRYEPASIIAKIDSSAVVALPEASITFDLTTANETVVFQNERKKQHWLSGDNWCANLFAENAITQITGAFNASGSN